MVGSWTEIGIISSDQNLSVPFFSARASFLKYIWSLFASKSQSFHLLTQNPQKWHFGKWLVFWNNFDLQRQTIATTKQTKWMVFWKNSDLQTPTMWTTNLLTSCEKFLKRNYSVAVQIEPLNKRIAWNYFLTTNIKKFISSLWEKNCERQNLWKKYYQFKGTAQCAVWAVCFPSNWTSLDIS